MKNLIFTASILWSSIVLAQKVTVSGRATDSSGGKYAIEIVVNDTLSKLMRNAKHNRQVYLRLYQDPRYVVRTDSTGNFSIKAHLHDSIYFKSFEHKTRAFLVKDLLNDRKVHVKLLPSQ